ATGHALTPRAHSPAIHGPSCRNLWDARTNAQQIQSILLSGSHSRGAEWCHAMHSRPLRHPDAGREQRLAGLRRSVVVALQTPAARDALPAARRALIQSIARPQLDAAVADGALGEAEARRVLTRLEDRYATRARRLRPVAGSS